MMFDIQGFRCFGVQTQSGIARPRGPSIFNFLRTSQLSLHSSCPTLRPRPQLGRQPGPAGVKPGRARHAQGCRARSPCGRGGHTWKGVSVTHGCCLRLLGQVMKYRTRGARLLLSQIWRPEVGDPGAGRLLPPEAFPLGVWTAPFRLCPPSGPGSDL